MNLNIPVMLVFSYGTAKVQSLWNCLGPSICIYDNDSLKLKGPPRPFQLRSTVALLTRLS